MELEKTLHQVSRNVESLKNDSQLFKREIEILKKENADLKTENARLHQNLSDIVVQFNTSHSAGTIYLQAEVSKLMSGLREIKHNLTFTNAMCHSLQERLNDFMVYSTHDMNEFSDIANHMQQNVTTINRILKGLFSINIFHEFKLHIEYSTVFNFFLLFFFVTSLSNFCIFKSSLF
jgi:chromosome segregation ATPase